MTSLLARRRCHECYLAQQGRLLHSPFNLRASGIATHSRLCGHRLPSCVCPEHGERGWFLQPRRCRFPQFYKEAGSIVADFSSLRETCKVFLGLFFRSSFGTRFRSEEQRWATHSSDQTRNSLWWLLSQNENLASETCPVDRSPFFGPEN